MTYYLAINGVQKDPVSEETLRAMIEAGSLAPDVLCWREGWPEWRLVTAVFPSVATPPPPSLRPSQAGATSPSVRATQATREQEALRNNYLRHEAALQSLGLLHVIGGSFALLMAAGMLAGTFLSPSREEGLGIGALLVLAAIMGALGFYQLRVGLWLRKVDPRGRTPATVFACIGLLGFPIGTIINIYFLSLLRSQKGEMVFSDYYQEIMAATPHIKYKTPLITWILGGLLIALLIGLIIAAATL